MKALFGPSTSARKLWRILRTGHTAVLAALLPGLLLVGWTAAAQAQSTAKDQDDSNPPWFRSLMAFEHFDSGRTKLFEKAHFLGSFVRENTVAVRRSLDDYPTPYNVVYLNRHSLFVYGGAYGDKGGTGSFVARVDLRTFRTVWYNQLIDTAKNGDWNYPGVLSALQDGFLYVIYGYHLAKLDPQTGRVLDKIALPTLAAPRDTSYNGLTGLPDGTLIAKAIYRQAGCEEQGFSAFLDCPDPTDIPKSVVVAIDPSTLKVIDHVIALEPIGGRITATTFKGHSYVYLPGQSTVFRYIYEGGRLRLDARWNPGKVVMSGQKGPSAPAVMNDWIVFATNGTPAPIPLSVVAINQADASKQFSSQPFAAVPTSKSLCPSAITVDPLHNRAFVLDAFAGRIAAIDLRDDGLHTAWTAPQRTTEFLTLIGPAQRRVLVGTDVPRNQEIDSNTEDFVVWRNADTGAELARSLQLAVNTGTMVEPGYAGRMQFLAENGKIIELTALPVGRAEEQLEQNSDSN